jgi:hypothetical protein
MLRGTVTETLGARLASRDAARFVGRSRELARLGALLEPDPPASVAFLHGPGGVGKSALMRELARRASARGWNPLQVDARDLAPLAEAIEAAIAPAFGTRRPLVLLDSWERLGALDPVLRGSLIPRLPADAIVVIGSRQPPASGWHEGGWENLVLDLRLGPLNPRDADALLESRGITEPEQRAAAVSWARGSPLALVLAAEAGGASAATLIPAESPAVAGKLLSRLLGAQPEGELRSVLAVAALARVTNRNLLARALPGINADRAFAWLLRHPSAEPLRDGVMLHDLVGQVLRADLRHRSPELERELRRRLVDALYADSLRNGLLQMTLDLQHLVQDPAIRWGFAWDTSGSYWVSPPRPGDIAAIAGFGGSAARAWLEGAERYFLQAPELVTVVRDRDGVIAGYGVTVTPATAPDWSAGDPLVGPRIRHAARHVPGGAALVCRQAVDLTRHPASPVTALIGMAGVIGSGLDNPAAAYLPITVGDAAAKAFSEACGAHPVDELALEYGGVRVECHVIDYGPGGLLAFQRAAVYRELGMPPPVVPAQPTIEVVREALRGYASPARLAASGLAPSEGPHEVRAARVKARIDEAVAASFGSSQADRLMRKVLVRGYLDPAPTHEFAAAELNLSRTAYFRHLRAAVERVAAQLGAS